MIKVVTTNGTTVHATEPGSKRMLTIEGANSIAKRANDRAEKLGISTRYKVEQD